ncbi:MAG: tetratricopeptide repeat protein, partial [Candidatus Acidiferrum sp.]
MTQPLQSRRIVRFGPFEVDAQAGELHKQGRKARLQEQPFQILLLLLERPGEVVTREEFRQKLWSADTFVDFEAGLNTAVKKLRDALEDLADQPRFIETLPRRGYRFIYPVDGRPIVTELPRLSAWWRERRVAGLLALAALLVAVLAANVGGMRDRLLGRPRAGEITSIAVLPLRNLTGDPEQDYFAEGMTEALITELGRFSLLQVPSHQSIRRYSRTEKPLPEIARELKVGALIEGTVLRSGNRVRVTINFVQATPERHLWSESYERDLRDVIAVQGDVTRAVAGQIRFKLTPDQQAHFARFRPVDPEANEAYLRGGYHFRKGTDADRAKAHEYFEKAIEKDPNFALAYASLAVLRAHGGFFRAGAGPLDAHTQTREWAKKALELDDTLAEAHAALGWIEMADWNWSGAEQEFKRAIELNPNLPVARTWYSQFLSYMRRFEESLYQAEIARRLDPVSPDTNVHSAETYLNAGRVDEAIESYRKVVELEPNYYVAHHSLAQAYIEKGLYQQAIEELEKAMALGGRDSL